MARKPDVAMNEHNRQDAPGVSYNTTGAFMVPSQAHFSFYYQYRQQNEQLPPGSEGGASVAPLKAPSACGSSFKNMIWSMTSRE